MNEDIIHRDFNPKTKRLVLVFKDKDSLDRHKFKFQDKIVTDDIQKETNIVNKSFCLICESSKINPRVENLSSIFKVEIKSWKEISSNCTIKINKLPNDFILPNWVPRPVKPFNLVPNAQTKVARGSATGFLYYSSFNDAHNAHNLLLQNIKLLSYKSAIGGSRIVDIVPVIDNLQIFVKWETEFESLEVAEHIFQNRSKFENIKISSWTTLTKKKPSEYFPKNNLDYITQQTKQRCIGSSCTYDLIENSNKVKIEMKNVSPSLINELKESIDTLFEPIILRLPQKTDPIRRFYFNKLFQRREFLEVWPAKYNVWIEKEAEAVRIFGEQINLGTFMFQIGEDYDDFLKRYIEISLEPEKAILFEKNRIGAARLSELRKKYGSVEISYNDKAIVIFSDNNDYWILKEIEEEVKRALNDISVTRTCITNDRCVYCGENSSLIELQICGHQSCKDCIEHLSKSTKSFPILCMFCKSPTHIDDFASQIGKNEKDTLVKNAIEFYLKSNQKTSGIKFCPLNCDGLINENNGYAKCSNCKTYVCGKCGSTDSLHANENCIDFKQCLKRFDKIRELISDGTTWVKQKWELPQIIEIATNPYLGIPDSPIRRLFDLGIQKLGISDASLKSGFLGWHGTSESSIDSICKNGFDPTRRSGQAYGTGEYFGLTSGISYNYCRNGNFMIVAFILKGPHVKLIEKLCHIVENPIDKSLTYCLPLLIVNFGVKKTICYDIGDSLTHTYVCYHWQNNSRHMEPYGQNSNEKIERQYMKYIESGKSDYETVVINLVKYDDDQPQNYLINFENMTQMNTNTKYIRCIQRIAVNLENSPGNPWEFEINGIWKKFDVLWQGKLEQSFKNYLNGIHHHLLNINLAPRPEAYEINFLNMTEKNTISGTIRQIRRINL